MMHSDSPYDLLIRQVDSGAALWTVLLCGLPSPHFAAMLPVPQPCPAARPRGHDSEAMEHDAMSHSTTTVSGKAAILSLTLCAVGCGDANNTPEAGLRVEVDDSAGVTIVENDPAAPDSRLPWQLGEQPSVSIGSVNSGEPDELFAVRDAMRLADGRIVIANLRQLGTQGLQRGRFTRGNLGPPG